MRPSDLIGRLLCYSRGRRCLCQRLLDMSKARASLTLQGGEKGMQRRLLLLATAGPGAILVSALIYFTLLSGASAEYLTPHQLASGNPAPISRAPAGGTSTPTVCPTSTPGPWTVRSPYSTDAFGVAAASDGTYAY